MQRALAATRSLAIARVRRRLLQESFPRLQMALIVALTGGFGLLASFSMLQFGLDSMAVRYPLALALAYFFFLCLIWLWLRTNAEDYLEVPNFTDIPRGNDGPSDGHQGFETGEDGDFGGGGASGSFDAPVQVADEAVGAPLRSAGEAASSVAEADELAIPLLAIALAVCLALASLYVVYIAPVLFAEVLVDGALSYALFRHLRGQNPQHWLVGTVRRTAMPFAATAVFLAATGAAMSAYAPGATSVGQVAGHASGTKGQR